MTCLVFITGPGISAEAQRYLAAADCALVVGDPNAPPEELVRRIRESQPDALIVRAGRVSAAALDAAPGLRVICKHGVGIDNIDVAAATARGIPVMFTPLANFEAVAEHTLALMLTLLRGVAAQDRRIRRGVFDKSTYRAVDLRGKTLGLIGFGHVARRVKELVAPFEMHVVAYHPSGSVGQSVPHTFKVRDVAEVFARADVLSLHCPLTDATRGMIDRGAIDTMKRGVYIVNTARGGLIDHAALHTALLDGRVAGAALDVFPAEPLPPDDPLLGLENVVVTPHVAGMSDGAAATMGMESARNVTAALRGDPLDPRSVVNPEVLSGREGVAHHRTKG